MSVLVFGNHGQTAPSNHSGASSVLCLLEEQDDSLKVFALEQLNANIEEFWFQVSGSIPLIEALYEDETFTHRELCALVLSKVFYHLDDLDEALMYALGANDLVEVNGLSDYSKTILACCVDTYTAKRKEAAKEGNLENDEVDERLLVIVERLFQNCMESRQFEQAVGLAVESHRLDMLEKALVRSSEAAAAWAQEGTSDPTESADRTDRTDSTDSTGSGLVQYILKTTHKSISSKRYRDDILELVVRYVRRQGGNQATVAAPGVATTSSADLTSIMKCLMVLDRPNDAAEIFLELVDGGEDDVLMAYQLGFDIYEAENQAFSSSLGDMLTKLRPASGAVAKEEPKSSADPADPAVGGAEVDPSAPGGVAEAQDAEMGTSEAPIEAPIEVPKDKMTLLGQILSGEIPMELERQFLARNNATDLQILKNIKATVEPRNSVCHGATVFANAMMNASTTNDSFLRENLDWLAKATNWSKFSATAGLGIIHKGNIKNSRSVLSPYLPSSTSSSSPYSEGGSLYAIGMMHSNHSAGITDFILNFLTGTQNEVIQHGACLGLGIAGMGSEDAATFEEIKNVLYNDNAVAGEAAGLAMGLLFAGSGTDRSEEMLAYAHDTQHEKIIRGIAIGLAAIQYGREEKADTIIETMTLDQDAILRYGGMFAIGLAYCGTGDNSAIQKLLHFAVSDVSNDVRRAAVLCLGFVLAGNPELCARSVSLLAESYNPHVRYGAAMALGISGAGSGCKESVSLLQSLWKDSTDFVQQGALIASAMLLIEHPECKQEKLRERINQLHGNRGVELMTRMGAIMASGILDAAGRNSTLSLHTDVGGLRRSAVLGLALFVQYWYWYPLTHTIALALKPTALIGVDATLAPPVDFKTVCNCNKSMFAYPAKVAVESKKLKEKVPKAMLSTSRKKKADTGKPDTAQDGKNTEEDTGSTPVEKTGDDAVMEDAANDGANAGLDNEALATEDISCFEMGNPARVVPMQREFVRFIDEGRWRPVRFQQAGIMVLKNTKPDDPVEYAFAGEEKVLETTEQPANEPAPQPFDYVPS